MPPAELTQLAETIQAAGDHHPDGHGLPSPRRTRSPWACSACTAPTTPTWRCTNADLLIAVGARFDDRVTGKIATFAPHAKIIHIDIDPTSIKQERARRPPDRRRLQATC
ncbi:MAG: hypothetical protein MZU95_15910 [Desulfomicrobium escambiense]|nr:hypothetical protein [Desulfomicrobium escambiense]